MTLEEFFTRLIKKMERYDFLSSLTDEPWSGVAAKQVIWKLQDLRNETVRPRDPEERLKKWRVVVRYTDGMGFFDEFKGNVKLRNELAEFLKGKT